jgi:hypothetical protein
MMHEKEHSDIHITGIGLLPTTVVTFTKRLTHLLMGYHLQGHGLHGIYLP